MTCLERIAEITACARGGAPDPALELHLHTCEQCAERFENERALAKHFRAVERATAGSRAPAEDRERLLQAFVAEHRRPPYLRSVLLAAALIIFTIGLGQALRSGLRAPEPREASPAVVEPDDTSELIAGGGFIPVPYSLPLASGESLRIVRMELSAAALTRLGIEEGSSSSGDNLTADLIVGEDDLPRAVRVLEESEL